MRTKPAWNLGVLVPLIVGGALVLEVVLRVLLPTEALAFRGWEVVRRYRPDGMVAQPNVTYYTPQTYGELANLGNLPALRQYRSERFTTDALGYRNPPELASSGKVHALLAGTSMSTGVGNSDENILSRQLSEVSGRTVYNASGLLADLDAEQLIATAAVVKPQERLVIVEWLERYDRAEPPGRTDACERLAGRIGLASVCMPIGGLLRVSPLQVFADHALRVVQDDVILPNTYASRVVQGRLNNGEPIAFWQEDVDAFYANQSDAAAAAAIQDLAADLRAADLDVLVVLVPHKYRVYRPLLDDGGAALDASYGWSAPTAPPFLDRLETRLAAAGIETMNLQSTFENQAIADLARGEYLYWRDDPHWNSRGIALAAHEIDRAWRLAENSSDGLAGTASSRSNGKRDPAS